MKPFQSSSPAILQPGSPSNPASLQLTALKPCSNAACNLRVCYLGACSNLEGCFLPPRISSIPSPGCCARIWGVPGTCKPPSQQQPARQPASQPPSSQSTAQPRGPPSFQSEPPALPNHQKPTVFICFCYANQIAHSVHFSCPEHPK